MIRQDFAREQETKSNKKLINNKSIQNKPYLTNSTDVHLLPSNLCRATLKRLDEAFKGFFRRVKKGEKAGFPRFKSMQGWNSFGFSEFVGIALENNRLYFKGLCGSLRLNMHQSLPENSKLLACVFKKSVKGWQVSLQVKENIAVQENSLQKLVGLDVGIEKLVALSNGNFIQKYEDQTLQLKNKVKKYETKIKLQQKVLARSKKGSNNRKKKILVLQRKYLKLSNIRKTYSHQVSRKIVNSYDFIGTEKLQIKSMVKSASGTLLNPGVNVKQKSGLNRSISNVSWGRLLNQIQYKAEWAGKVFIKVDPKNTSQECSCCGKIVKKLLSDRIHICDNKECGEFGISINRDTNAARNILHKAWDVFNKEKLIAHGIEKQSISSSKKTKLEKTKTKLKVSKELNPASGKPEAGKGVVILDEYKSVLLG